MRSYVLKTVAMLLLGVSTVSCSKPQTEVVNAKSLDNGTSSATPDTGDKSTHSDSVQPVVNLSGDEIAKLKENLKNNLKASGFETHIQSISATQMPSLYWARAEGLPAFFTDKSGSFIIQGDVIKLGGKEPVDVSAPLRQNDAINALAAVKASDMITFKPKGEVKASVYAFTDIDCGYCRKLHNEMDDITARGIEVHYLAWPRAQQSIAPMENIWCSKDKNTAMTKSKRGETIAKAPACDNPVKAQIDLGMQLGVRGTPAIFAENGEQIGGYVPAAQLAEQAIAKKITDKK